MLITPPASAQCPDGSTGSWSVGPAQRAAGPLGTIHALLSFDPDGPGPEPVSVIAGGSFAVAGSTLARNIAYWNGTEWRPMGPGFDAQVLALAVFNGELYAAGAFQFSGTTPCARIARWNGSSWVALGAGLNAEVRSLAVFSSRLYAGGTFTSAGGVAANAVASWDGSLWRSLGNAIPGGGVTRDPASTFSYTPSVNAMAVFNARLYVGGGFERANGAAIATLATWDGASFAAIGPITTAGQWIPLPEIHAMAVFNNDLQATSTLYVGGEFNTINGVAANYIASFTRTPLTSGPWVQVGATIDGPVYELALQTSLTAVTGITVSSSRRIIDNSNWVAGTYRYASGAWNILSTDTATALLNRGGVIHAGIRGCSVRVNSDWLPLGPGLNANPLLHAIDGSALYLSGPFTVADQQLVGGIVRLDAAGYQPVGAGIMNATSTGLRTVFDIAALNGEVFAAGFPGDSASTSTIRVIRFNGTNWVGTPVPGTPFGFHQFAVIDGSVYLGVSAVFRWNGLAWQQVGGAVPNNRVEDIFMWNNTLHVSGQGGVYRLDGATWTLAYPLRGNFLFANTAAVWNGRLFISMSAQGLSGIDELVNGQFVESFAGAFPRSYAEYGGSLYAALPTGLARFDGSSWQVVSSGGGSAVDVLNGLLTVIGTQVIDGVASPVFAQLQCCPADINASGSLTIQDIFDFLNAWFNGQSSADFNASGTLTIQDIFDFLNAWFAGC